MKFSVTEAECKWLNEKMGQLQEISERNQDTARMAHMANKIRYNTDGLPSQVFLTRPQRALVTDIARFRFQTLDLVPCEEREIVVSLLQKVTL